MLLATTFPLSSRENAALQPGSILVRTDTFRDDSSLIAFLIREGIDTLLTDKAPSRELLSHWRLSKRRPIIVLIANDHQGGACSETPFEDGIIVSFNRANTLVADALAAAERSFTERFTARESIDLVSFNSAKQRQKIIVVGAGIVSLMTARELVDAGHMVEIIERSADPRLQHDWTNYGCTYGGENVRMFSLTECDNYHDRDYKPGAELHRQLNHNIQDMGWLLGHRTAYTEEDACWVRDFISVPIWLAAHYNEDIFSLNQESFALWKDILQNNPELTRDTNLTSPLLRIASTKYYNSKQVVRQKHVGSFIRELDEHAIAEHYPALATGCTAGEIAAGIEVHGFTLKIHDFANNIISHLLQRGARFHWNTEVGQIIREVGAVVGLQSDREEFIGDHYFLSPGAYGNRLLSDSASANKIHGMLGAWITVPNLEPKLQRSLKVSREGHIANSGNIIVTTNERGEDVLVFGSGFGYVGHDLGNIDQRQLEALFVSMEDYIRELFPAAYHHAAQSGQLKKSRRYCIRPWTASSLGLFEIQKAANGLLIIASGHNTGGFSQSPSIAKATLDAIEGRQHPMHSIYHPERFDRFWTRRRPWWLFDETIESLAMSA